MNKLFLVACLSMLVATCASVNFQKRATGEDVMLTSELEAALRRSLLSDSPVEIYGRELNLQYSKSSNELIPVDMYSEHHSISRVGTLRNEHFRDAVSGALFTVTHFTDNDNKVEKLIHASIPISAEEEYIVEPYLAAADGEKREADEYSMITRRSFSRHMGEAEALEAMSINFEEKRYKQREEQEIIEFEEKRHDKNREEKRYKQREEQEIIEFEEKRRDKNRGEKRYKEREEQEIIEFEEKRDKNREEKRGAGPTNNYVEVQIVVDYQYYTRAQTKLKEKKVAADDANLAKYLSSYLSQIVSLANTIYKDSFEKTPEIKIALGVKGLLILNNQNASPMTAPAFHTVSNGKSTDDIGRQYTNTNAVLKEFNTWLLNLKYAKALDKSYDVAVLFTGTNLITPQADELGVAYLSGACTGYQSGMLVEDKGDFDSDLTLGHEMAHTMGVKHDPDVGCPNTLNHVMSTSYQMKENAQNNHFFSSCSHKQFVANIITTNGFACLANAPAVPLPPAVKPGQLFSLTDQCKGLFGPTSTPMIQKDSNICQTLFCKIGNKGSAHQGALDKSSCASGKWCHNGVCTADAAAPKGDCLFEAPADCAEQAKKFVICPANGAAPEIGSDCCAFCKKGAVLIEANTKKNYMDWIAKIAAHPNIKTLSATPANKCTDADFCANNVPVWLKDNPKVCTDGTKTNGAAIGAQCKNACGICD